MSSTTVVEVKDKEQLSTLISVAEVLPTPTELPTTPVEEEEAPEPHYEEHDLVIIGAGISGINMSYRFQSHFPKKSYVVLEQRNNMGGTWDIMRYPGIRSDSDLFTFGFAWRPWADNCPIAKGALIVKYMKESAQQYGIDKQIRFRHQLKEARWQSRSQTWDLTVEAQGEAGKVEQKHFRCKYLCLGSGYYDYTQGMEAKINGLSNFKGQVIHPQFWPENLDYANKKIAVIGSGATAITLIPALAEKAQKVTMVQRSPSYVLTVPNRVVVPTTWWEKIIPRWLFHRITRLRYLWRSYTYAKYFKDSDAVRGWILKMTEAQLPKHIPVDPHFKPTYKVWDQRVCMSPDGDFFQAMRDGKADVATGIIKNVTSNTIEMEDGVKVDADIIVTATGLRVNYGGNAAYYVDGERINFGDKFLWKGALLQDMPNSCMVLGYAKASWTLAADATATLFIRMIKHTEKNGYSSWSPRISDASAVPNMRDTLQGLKSTYIKTALQRIPKSSDVAPWKDRGAYEKDMWDAMYGTLTKGMQFTLKPNAAV